MCVCVGNYKKKKKETNGCENAWKIVLQFKIIRTMSAIFNDSSDM